MLLAVITLYLLGPTPPILGVSCEPILHTGHIYCAKRIPFADLKEGMFVAYINDYNHVPTCHPIHRWKGRQWVAQAIYPYWKHPSDAGFVTERNYLYQVLPIEYNKLNNVLVP